MISSQWYNPIDAELAADRLAIKQILQQFNSMSPALIQERHDLLRPHLGGTQGDFYIEQPFLCDYGYNIHLGEGVYINYHWTVLDCAPVRVGAHTLIGPNVSLYTAIHPLSPQQRNTGIETAKPITIGDNVWIGGSVTILPGITIGDNAVIGAGSVVTHNIPAWAVAVGNPCRVLKTIPHDEAKRETH